MGLVGWKTLGGGVGAAMVVGLAGWVGTAATGRGCSGARGSSGRAGRSRGAGRVRVCWMGGRTGWAGAGRAGLGCRAGRAAGRSTTRGSDKTLTGAAGGGMAGWLPRSGTALTGWKGRGRGEAGAGVVVGAGVAGGREGSSGRSGRVGKGSGCSGTRLAGTGAGVVVVVFTRGGRVLIRILILTGRSVVAGAGTRAGRSRCLPPVCCWLSSRGGDGGFRARLAGRGRDTRTRSLVAGATGSRRGAGRAGRGRVGVERAGKEGAGRDSGLLNCCAGRGGLAGAGEPPGRAGKCLKVCVRACGARRGRRRRAGGSMVDSAQHWPGAGERLGQQSTAVAGRSAAAATPPTTDQSKTLMTTTTNENEGLRQVFRAG